MVPSYNEQETLALFVGEVLNTQQTFDDEGYKVKLQVLFINDGSRDDTLKVMQELHQEYPTRVEYINFSRNFGKEAAILAGLQYAQGQYIALMDADLQDPPHMLVDMYKGIKYEGYDIVGSKRVNREGEPPIRSYFATLYYKLNNKVSDTQLEEGVRDYRLMTRPVVESILALPERNRFSKGLLAWVGYKVKYLDYYNVERSAGETSWSFKSLFTYAIEGMMSFSDIPLTLTAVLGFTIFGLAGLYGVYIVINTLLFGATTSGWPSLAVLIVGMGGLQLFCMGIIGKYIGKIYTETKQRPHYIVRDHQPLQKGKEEA